MEKNIYGSKSELLILKILICIVQLGTFRSLKNKNNGQIEYIRFL
jgi:hypothetical protein